MSVLGLIPARGGSKGIPRKNLALLGGHPLIAWTCAGARASRRLDRVLVSTDDAEIAAVARSCGAEAPFLRPDSLATDESTSVDAARHALEWLEQHEGWAPDILVLLQPTSPFRTGSHIGEALDLLATSGADTVVSVVKVPHRYSPFSVMRRDDAGWLQDFWTEPTPFDRFRRQEHPELFARNGPAVLATRASIVSSGSFYGARVAGYAMSDETSIDIDSPEDLERAEMLIARKGLTPCVE